MDFHALGIMFQSHLLQHAILYEHIFFILQSKNFSYFVVKHTIKDYNSF